MASGFITMIGKEKENIFVNILMNITNKYILQQLFITIMLHFTFIPTKTGYHHKL